MEVRSSAPTRIDLAGGTLDIWPLYLFHPGAQTVNAAISLRASCSVTPSSDGRVHLVSNDTKSELTADNWRGLDPEGEHRLIVHIARFFQVANVCITTEATSPLGAGIAGSSALNVAVCAALARWRRFDYSADQLMTLAMNLEALTLGIPTGVQDYRPALYGGISAIELDALGVRHIPLHVNSVEFGHSLVLAYSGDSRSSGLNNWDITKRHIEGNKSISKHFQRIADIASAARHALTQHDWTELARQIRLEWRERKALAPGVTTPAIERLMAQAEAAGALAGKVCGAGGGGCVFFVVEPGDRDSVRRAITDTGAQLLESAIDTVGLKVNTL